MMRNPVSVTEAQFGEYIKPSLRYLGPSQLNNMYVKGF